MGIRRVLGLIALAAVACTSVADARPHPSAPSATPPADDSSERRYTNERLGISFDPVITTTGTRCVPRETGNGDLLVGRVVIARELGGDLDRVLDAWIARTAVTVEHQAASRLDGRAAIAIEYRDRGTARMGLATFAGRTDDAILVAVAASGASPCGVPDTEIYAQILRTIRIRP